MLWSWFCRQLQANNRRCLSPFFSPAPLLLCSLALLLFVLPSFSQQRWERTYGGSGNDYGNSVQQTSDGGYIIAGTTSSFGAGNEDVYLIKTNSFGDTLWTRTYGGPSNDGGRSVRITRDSGYIIAGYTYSFGRRRGDVYLIKTNSLGDTIWTRTYDALGDRGCDVQQTTDGGYIVLGNTRDSIKIIKTNPLGDTLWISGWKYWVSGVGEAIVQANDKGYAITGSVNDIFTGFVLLLKTDSLGNYSWLKAWSGPIQTPSGGNALERTTDGGYVIAGMYCGLIYPGDVFFVKTDNQGNTQLLKYYGDGGGSRDDIGYSVQQTGDGGYIVAGYSGPFQGPNQVYLIKTNASGDTLWTRTFGGANSEQGNSVQVTRDGGYIIAGFTNSFGAGGYDVYLIKTDSLGRSSGVEENPALRRTPYASRLTVSPNPFTSFASVPGHSSERFSLYDISGRKVGVFKGDRIGEGLSAGVYFLRPEGKDAKLLRAVKVR